MLEMTSLCDGIILVGEAFSGKTILYQVFIQKYPEYPFPIFTFTLCKVVAKVLGRLGREADGEENSVHRTIMNPKALTINQMYGFFDELNEWNDGILATTYRFEKTYSQINSYCRNFSNMSPKEWKWLIFDGPVSFFSISFVPCGDILKKIFDYTVSFFVVKR